MEGKAYEIRNAHNSNTRWIYLVSQKRGHFVLWSASLEIVVTSATNVAQIKVTSFWTLWHNSFKPTLENKVAPYSFLNKQTQSDKI